MTGVWKRLRDKIQRIFPERQIYHRTEGRVSYLAIGTKWQLAGVACLSALAIWMLYGTASVFLRDYVISSHERSTAYKIAHYERLLQEARAREASARNLLRTRTEEFQLVTDTLEQRHDMLRSLLSDADATKLAADTSGRVMMASVSADARPRESRIIAEASSSPAQFAANAVSTRLTSLETEQDRLMAIAETKAQARIETVKEAVRVAGLRLSDLAEGADLQRGGPYVQLEDAALENLEGEFNDRVLRVAARIAEAEEMESALASAPLGHPVQDQARMTSAFGARIDPMTKRAAFHTGLDIGAYWRAPILATAPGVVSYSGWKGGYGRVVEIDHGRSFKTRYAHMSQTSVKKGDRVEMGDQVGTMGSTGRSSGTHLHYEVWFKGKVHDPAKFIKAGEYVQQS